MNDSSITTSSLAGRAPRLDLKLRRLHARLCWTEGSRRLAIALAGVLTIAGLAMLIDWWLELSLTARYVSFGIQLVIVGALLTWVGRGIITRMRHASDDLALMVERANPLFQGRLISTVQFANGQAASSQPESEALMENVIRETERVAEPQAFSRAINYRPWRRALTICGIVSTLSLALWLVAGAVIHVLFERQFFADTPIPRRTQIAEINFAPRVGVGDTIEILIRAEGRLPDRGKLWVRYASGIGQKLDLLPKPSAENTFFAVIDAVPESFSWKARVNDARIARQSVTAIHRPLVEGVRLRQHYPDFMNLESSIHEPGDFHLFPGAQVELEIFTNKPIASGTLTLLGVDQALTLAPAPGTPEDPVTTAVTVPESDMSGFTIELCDHDGMESREPAAYRISLATDAPPTIQIVEPRRSEDTATPTATVMLAWKASDRFGIREFVLCRQYEGDAGVHRETIPLADDADMRNARMEYAMNLAEVAPSPEIGSKLKLWVEAIDINPATGPGTSRSLHLGIITPEEKRQQLLGRVADALGHLEGVASDQETLNEKLNEIIREK